MTQPSALLAIQDGSGAVENQGQGYIQQLVPGDIAKFTLQSIAGVLSSQRWVLSFESPDSPTLDSLVFSWSPDGSGMAPEFDVNLPPGGFTSRYVTTIYDLQNAISQFTGEIIGIGGGGGGGGGGTITTANFTQPAVGSSNPMIVGSTLGILAGASVSLVGGGRYAVVGAPSDLTHLVALNLGTSGNATPGMTIAAGATIGPSNDAPLAAQARLPGQALQLVPAKADTPAGIPTVRHAWSYDNGTMGTVSVPGDITFAMKAALADTTTKEPIYIPPGQNSVTEPLLPPAGTIIRGVSRLPNTGFGSTSIVSSGGGTRYGHIMLGPIFAIIPPSLSSFPVTYTLRAGRYFKNFPGLSIYGNPITLLNLYEPGSINALAAVTAEATINYTSGAESNIFYSDGAKSTGSALTTALELQVSGVSSPYGVTTALTTSVTGHVTFANNPVLPAGSDQAIAMDYDGAHVRLYIQGVVQATSVAATGTIVQPWYENFYMGAASGPGMYPCSWSDMTGVMQLASVRLSNSARYAGVGYTPAAGQFAPDGNTKLLFNFDPAFRFANYWDVAYGFHPSIGAVECFYPTFGVVATGTDNNGNVQIEDLGIASNSIGIYAESSQNCTYRRLNLFSVAQGILAVNNCYDGIYDDITMTVNARSANVTSRNFGICLTQVSGLAVVNKINIGTCHGDWGMVFSVGGLDFSNSIVNQCSLGGMNVRAMEGSQIRNVVFGDEGGAFGWTGALFDSCYQVRWESGGVSNFNGGAGTSCVVVDGGVDIMTAADFALGAAGGMIQFVAPPVDIDATPVAVRVETRYQGQLLFNVKGQWGDGTGPLIVVPQELNGNGPITFPSDANYTPNWNAQAWGYVTVDTTACSATRNLVLPRNIGKRTKVKVIGGHSVVPLGPTGTGPTLASGTTTDIYDNGTNYVAA